MGYEYRAELGIGDPSVLETVRQALCLAGKYSLERSSQDAVALRFSRKPRQSDWPEDFTLYCDNSGLLLNIHSGTGQEREEIVRDVELALSQAGQLVSFEEI